MSFYKILIFVSLCVQSISLFASQNINPKLEELSGQRTWLKLVLYEGENSNYLSAIKTQEFFLSKQGRTNPYEELLATISALNSPFESSEANNQHASCRFPARLLWLQKRVPQLIHLDNRIVCSEFLEWSGGKNTESISIVFATGYLGNPASFYGHTLLKFNSSLATGKTILADVSVNYGAIIPDDENPVVYIVKGLFGGYDAGFTHINYYFHNHNYGENELRDLWEYELSLSPSESQFVVAHAWEVLGQKYTYFFLRQNCAYRMAELLDIIDDIDIKPNNPAYLIPQSLIQKLSETQHKSSSLVKRVTLHPSRQSRFYSRYQELNTTEREVASGLIDSDLLELTGSYQLLPKDSQKKVVDTLIDYYQFVLKKNKEDSGQSKLNYDKLISLRFSLPLGDSNVSEKQKVAPHEGRYPSYTNFSWVNNEFFGEQLAIKVRPAYYDSLDSGTGHIVNSSLSMAEFEIRLGEGYWYLSQFNVFKVESVNSRTTGLKEDEGNIWNMQAGWVQLSSDQENKVFSVQGDYGTSFKPTESTILTPFVGGGLQDKYKDYSNLFIRIGLSTHFNFSEKLRFRVNWEHKAYLDSVISAQNIYSLYGRYELSLNKDIRLFYQDDGNREFGLSMGFYW